MKRGDIPGRAGCLALLKNVRTPAAKERLLRALTQDPGRLVRIAAAQTLGSFGGNDVRQALERTAAEDKFEEVRAAARKALEELDKTAPQKPSAPK